MTVRCLLFSSVAILCAACGGSALDELGGRGDESPDATGGQRNLPTGGSGTTNTGGGSTGGRSVGGENTGGTGGGENIGGLGGAGTGGEPLVPHVPSPSSGCSAQETPPEVLEFEVGPIYVSLPPHYDGETPLPIIIGFHPFGDSLGGLVDPDHFSDNPLPEGYVIVRPKAQNVTDHTWEGATVEQYDLVYQEIERKVCFDESRVFGVGSGGGARFLSQAVCKPRVEGVVRPAEFRALALNGPLRKLCESWPSLPLLQIHGEQEVGGNNSDRGGIIALGAFKESKQCDDSPPPSYPSGLHYTCTDFDGCSSPLRFCSHNVKLDYVDEWIPYHPVEFDKFFADYL